MADAPTLRTHQSGVLLLEVLISVLIFSIALLGLVAMQARAVQFSIDAEERNRAALLANDMVSTMWARKSADSSALANEISAWRSKAQAALPPYNSTVVANVSAPDSDGVVTVTLGWTPVGNKSASHSYITRITMP